LDVDANYCRSCGEKIEASLQIDQLFVKHELSVKDVLIQTFRLYRKKFVIFYIPYLGIGLVTGLLSFMMISFFPPPAPPGMIQTVSQEPYFEYLFEVIKIIAIYLGLVGGSLWVMSTIVIGFTIRYASDLLAGEESSVRDVFSSTITRLVSLFALTAITDLLIFLGALFFIVPGIILACMFSLTISVIMIEQVGALESLGRSRKLVSKRWGKTFVLYLSIGVIVAVIAIVEYFLFTAVWFQPSLVGTIVRSIWTSLFSPILPIALTFHYYSMIAREARMKQTFREYNLNKSISSS